MISSPPISVRRFTHRNGHCMPSPARVLRISWCEILLVVGIVVAAWRIPSPAPPRFVVHPAQHATNDPPRVWSIFLPTPSASAHSASVAALPGGDLLVAWFSGTSEGASDVTIEFARVRDGNVLDTWTALTREELQDALKRVVRKLGNPVIGVDAHGVLHLFVVSVSYGGWSGGAINHLESTDEGRSWHSIRRLVLSPFFNLSTLVRTSIVPLADGTIGLPAYHEFIHKWGLWVRLTRDGAVLSCAQMPQPVPALQPAVAPIDDHRAAAALRFGGSGGDRIPWSLTEDGGKTWQTEPPRALLNPNSSVAMIRLSDGSLLLAANPHATERSLLQLFRSHDEGRTWTLARSISHSDDPYAEVSYPALEQDGAGQIILAYTDRRSSIRVCGFNLSWLDADLDEIPVTVVQPPARSASATLAEPRAWSYGLVAQVLVVATVLRLGLTFARWCSRSASAARRRGWMWLPLGVGAAAISVVPIDGLPIAWHLHGLIGDPSVTSAVLMSVWIVAPDRLPPAPRTLLAAVPLVVLLLLLYLPLSVFPAMGIDTYALGWRPWVLLLFVAVAGVVIRVRSARGVCLAIGAAAPIAYAMGLLESDNLWDYLVDPMLLMFGVGSCLATLAVWSFRRFVRGTVASA
ncbi:MAG: exo-alpha-sialidase [Phycisphaerales bacterium]|nr:exo-alpha-sialidase [Phycisphaerales bacterium]